LTDGPILADHVNFAVKIRLQRPGGRDSQLFRPTAVDPESRGEGGTMDWHELNKTRVKELREMMGEHLPDVTGITAMKKEEIVELLAEKLGIEKPHKTVAKGTGKGAIKAKIGELKMLRQQALEAKDQAELKKQRRAIHRLKRKLRRMAQTA
jgi:hypothetical protein